MLLSLAVVKLTACLSLTAGKWQKWNWDSLLDKGSKMEPGWSTFLIWRWKHGIDFTSPFSCLPGWHCRKINLALSFILLPHSSFFSLTSHSSPSLLILPLHFSIPLRSPRLVVPCSLLGIFILCPIVPCLSCVSFSVYIWQLARARVNQPTIRLSSLVPDLAHLLIRDRHGCNKGV
jgi:hypothetical protein